VSSGARSSRPAFGWPASGSSPTFPDAEKDEQLDAAVEEMLEDDGVGIVVMHDEDMDHLSRGVRKDAETSVEPVLVTLGGGAGSGGLRDQIKRAIGIDLMEED